MATGVTTTTDYGYTLNTYLAKDMLDIVYNNSVFKDFGEKANIPTKNTKTITWSLWNELSDAEEITEAVQPGFEKFSKSTVSATLKWYGKGAMDSDVMELTIEDPILNGMKEVVSHACKQKFDKLTIATLYTTTSQWSSDDSSDDDVNFSFDGSTFTECDVPIDAAALRACWAELRGDLVKPVTPKVVGSTRVGSAALRASYILFAPTAMTSFFLGLTGFTEVHEYSGDSYIYQDELGYIEGFRVILSDNMTYASTTGGSGAETIYPMILMGMVGNQYPFATVDLAGMGTQMWHYPMGTGEDLYHQYNRVVGKFAYAGAVLRDIGVAVLYAPLT